MKKFIDHYKDENVSIKYSAGVVEQYGKDFIVAYEQMGAKETFSIGQPVYDKDKNLMGYLGIGLYKNLDYSTDGIRIPVETWTICLPTKHCVGGKKIFTYWQTVAEMKES